jgi:hypothetical protein
VQKKTCGELLFDFLKHYSYEFFCNQMAMYPALPDDYSPVSPLIPKTYTDEDYS